MSGDGLPPARRDMAEAHPGGRQISPVWLVPAVAVVIGIWLVVASVTSKGPLITIEFQTAEGLTAGQTVVKHKAVSLGTVETITLTKDLTHVRVQVRMRHNAIPALTSHARFWVVRPRLAAGNISGLETVLSGSYIELDPGTPGGAEQDDFVGLETPPPIVSDQPGRQYTLTSDRLGSLSVGSPIYYRDVQVGEVLSYDVGRPDEKVIVHAFVEAPYCDYVHEDSYFWNDSGISIEPGTNGLRVRLQSVQAALTGGVAFATPIEAMGTPVAPALSDFKLFDDLPTAESSHYRERVRFLLHVHGSVAGLAVGAPVEIYGIQVGVVSGIQLHIDPETLQVDVKVRIELEPERVPHNGPLATPAKVVTDVTRFVAHGFRAQIRVANFVTGQMMVALDFFPDAEPATVSEEGGENVLPVQPSTLEDLQRNFEEIANRLGKTPIDRIADNLNHLLAGASAVVNAPELKSSLKDLAASLHETRDLVGEAETGVKPALAKLPAAAAALQASLQQSAALLAALNEGSGGNSAFGRQLSRILTEVSETLRSLRGLADELEAHPDAVILGRRP